MTSYAGLSRSPKSIQTPVDRVDRLYSGLWIAATALVFSLLLIANYLRPDQIDGAELAELGYASLLEPSRVGDFRLIDGNGADVDGALLTGRWSLVFFGYRHCPDVCPTTLAVLSQVARSLDERMPQTILVSIDPDRDDWRNLGEYVKAFDRDFGALTGSPGEVANLATRLHVVFADADSGSVDHTTNIALVNPAGEFVGYFRIPHRAEAISLALDRLGAADMAWDSTTATIGR